MTDEIDTVVSIPVNSVELEQVADTATDWFDSKL